MPGTTWNWIRCSKFSSRVRSLQKPGTEPSPVFHWASEGNLLPTSTCQRSHTPLPIWPSKTNSSRKIENAAVIEGKRSASAPHSRSLSLSNATSRHQFGLPSQQSTLIRVTTTKQRGAASACDGSGGYSGPAFGSAAPVSDLASQPQQFAPALYEIIRNGARKTRSKVGRHSARAAFGYPRSIAIPQSSNRFAPFCGRFSQGT